MSEALHQQQADERGESIRALLANPLVNNARQTDSFRLIIRHRQWLVDWFESTFGWRLEIDTAAGFARLFKRTNQPDVSRVLRSTRGQKRAFDRRRYQLLCLVCAGLVKHPVTTIGMLADTLRNEANLDTTVKRERSALVDALRALIDWQVVTLRSGDVDAYLDSEENNAIVYADTHRLHQLLSSVTAPSKLKPTLDALAACDALLHEPRYADAASGSDDITEAERLRFARHTAARRLLDDPVVYVNEEAPAIADYIDHSSGRRWLRERCIDAGFELEERKEGLLAIDPSTTATDKLFPSPIGTVGQVALLLIERLITSDNNTDARIAGSMSVADQKQFIKRLLKQQPRWAKTWREGNEPMRLVTQAVTLLGEFNLVIVDDTGRVNAKPALARYRVTADFSAAKPTTASNRSRSATTLPSDENTQPDEPPEANPQITLL